MTNIKLDFCRIENMNDCTLDEHADTTFYTELNLLERGLNNPQINLFDVQHKPAIYLEFKEINDIIQYIDLIIRTQRMNKRLIKKLSEYLNYVISFDNDLNKTKDYYLNKLK